MATNQKMQKIYMVTGKGGVGKSVVAAALANQFAREGYKTLLVELGDVSYLQNVLLKNSQITIGYEPTPISTQLWASLWNGESCLKEYILYLIKVKKLADLFLDNKIMRTFVRAAPALKELAILGKITSGVRQWGPPLEFDRIVVDAYSTGHFLALLKAPIGMAELIPVGPMGEQSRSMQKVLCDPEKTNYLLVTKMEDLPITETFELQAELQKWVNQSGQIVANQYFNSQLNSKDKENLKAEVQGHQIGSWLLNHVELLDQRSQDGLEKLKKMNAKVTQVPLVLSTSPLEVIQSIANREALV